MNILTINCGSSSLKYQLFAMPAGKPLLKGMAERIGGTSLIVHEKEGRVFRRKQILSDHRSAVESVAALLTHKQWGALTHTRDITAVGHRVVHGGEDFKQSVAIDATVLKRIKDYAALAPLHNPPAYNGIVAARACFPRIAQVAVFDTAFHQTMPQQAFMYGLPYELYRDHAIRRYGFHGTSHRYVARQAAQLLKRPLNRLKLITCHLGNGCSITAIKDGQSVDTSMGFTPLEGLVMGTRCGDIDPALISYIMDKKRCTAQDVINLCNRKSGILGLSGISNDMRDVQQKAEQGNKRAQLAIDVFIYRVKKYIGAYWAVLNGADAVVLTAGIGENMRLIHQRLRTELSALWNSKRKTAFLIIHTDEERLIAEDTYAVISSAA